uniref:Uncharacterized protein n=1 Tax=Glossina austeni TaxID=7395 RepID=A0A1A9VLX5_GLOAU
MQLWDISAENIESTDILKFPDGQCKNLSVEYWKIPQREATMTTMVLALVVGECAAAVLENSGLVASYRFGLVSLRRSGKTARSQKQATTAADDKESPLASVQFPPTTVAHKESLSCLNTSTAFYYFE